MGELDRPSGVSVEKPKSPLDRITETLRRASPAELDDLGVLLKPQADQGSPFHASLRRDVIEFRSSLLKSEEPLVPSPAGNRVIPSVLEPAHEDTSPTALAPQPRPLESASPSGLYENISAVYSRALGRPVSMETDERAITRMGDSITALTESVVKHRERIGQMPSQEALDKAATIPFGVDKNQQEYVLDMPPGDERLRRQLARTVAAQFLASGVPLKSQRLLHAVLAIDQEGSGRRDYGGRVGEQIAQRSSFPREIAKRISALSKTTRQQPDEQGPDISANLQRQAREDIRLLTQKFSGQPIPGFPGCDAEFIAQVIEAASGILWKKAIYGEEERFDGSMQDLQKRARSSGGRDFSGTISSPDGKPGIDKRAADFPPFDMVPTDYPADQLLRAALGMDIVAYLERQKPGRPIKEVIEEEFNDQHFRSTGERSLDARLGQAGSSQVLDNFWLTSQGIADTPPSGENLNVRVLTDGKTKIEWPRELITSMTSDAGSVMADGARIYDRNVLDTVSSWFSKLSETVGMREAVRGVEQLAEQAAPGKKVNLFAVVAKDMFDKYTTLGGSDNDKQRRLHAALALAKRAKVYAETDQGIDPYDYAKNNITPYKLAKPLLESTDPGPYLSELIKFGSLDSPQTGDSRSDLRTAVENRGPLMEAFFTAFKRQIDHPTIAPEEVHAHIKAFGANKYGLERFAQDHISFADPKDEPTRKAYTALAEWLVRYNEIGLSSSRRQSGPTSSFSRDFQFEPDVLSKIIAPLNDTQLSSRLEAIKKEAANS